MVSMDRKGMKNLLVIKAVRQLKCKKYNIYSSIKKCNNLLQNCTVLELMYLVRFHHLVLWPVGMTVTDFLHGFVTVSTLMSLCFLCKQWGLTKSASVDGWTQCFEKCFTNIFVHEYVYGFLLAYLGAQAQAPFILVPEAIQKIHLLLLLSIIW